MSKISDSMDSKFEGFDRWEVEDALRACQTYKKLEKNKKLMAAVGKMAKMKLEELQGVVDEANEPNDD